MKTLIGKPMEGRRKSLERRKSIGTANLKGIEYAKQLPISYRNVFLKAITGKSTRGEVIRAKCQSCVNFEDVKHRIQDCSCFLCPIWAYRPYQLIKD